MQALRVTLVLSQCYVVAKTMHDVLLPGDLSPKAWV